MQECNKFCKHISFRIATCKYNNSIEYIVLDNGLVREWTKQAETSLELIPNWLLLLAVIPRRYQHHVPSQVYIQQ